ncbi:hypothetical protein DXG03_009618 [Asterophora parasitica]|uniref:DUF7330 domain-containing protein n=1 Tax=Asterophora parasitica TaxID=117018 RepID=A0A9P7GAN3_9AGAR|nr:hypothetical protein DXG03_009618 [Asterophora parasitica]
MPKPSVHPRMALEVISRGGNIVLFVPKSFSGVVQISTRKGSIELLPALASSMNVLKESEHEALIMVGDQHSVTDSDVNFCELTTRSGKIIVGISELDKIDAKIGFWKKLVSLFGGQTY